MPGHQIGRAPNARCQTVCCCVDTTHGPIPTARSLHHSQSDKGPTHESCPSHTLLLLLPCRALPARDCRPGGLVCALTPLQSLVARQHTLQMPYAHVERVVPSGLYAICMTSRLRHVALHMLQNARLLNVTACDSM